MFFMGLDDAQFGNVCTDIIRMEPLPDLNSVYQRVVSEERRLLSTRAETKQDAVGFMAKSDPSQSENTTMNASITAVARSRGAMACSHCGRTGHEKKDCWQIIGFPEWWNERNQAGECGGRGRRRGCGRNQARSNAVQASTSAGSSIPSLTNEHWASLTALLEQQKMTPIPEKLNGKV